jgi:hypothetical protein
LECFQAHPPKRSSSFFFCVCLFVAILVKICWVFARCSGASSFFPRLGKDSWFLLEAIRSILLQSPFVSDFVVVVVVSVREFYFGVFLFLYSFLNCSLLCSTSTGISRGSRTVRNWLWVFPIVLFLF